MDWDKLRVFRIIAEAGSFTHGGERLNLSQSAVSRKIKSLEKELGATLFSRHARGLVLTSEGELLLDTVRSVFSQLENTKALVSESSGNHLSGIVKLACSNAFGTMWLSSRMHEFQKQYPDIRTHMVLTDQSVNFSMREADIAVSFHSNYDSDIVKHHLMKYHIQAFSSVEYINRMGEPKKVEELDKHQIISFGEENALPALGANWLTTAGKPPGVMREPRLVIPSAIGIIHAIRSGFGIGTVAEYIAVDYPDLIRVIKDEPVPEINATVQYPEQFKNSPRIMAVRDFLMDKLKGHR